LILLEGNALVDLVSNFRKIRLAQKDIDLEAANETAELKKLQWQVELSNDNDSTYMIGAVFVWLWLLLLAASPF